MRLDDSDGDDAVHPIFEADIFKFSVLHKAASFEVKRSIVLTEFKFPEIYVWVLNVSRPERRTDSRYEDG